MINTLYVAWRGWNDDEWFIIGRLDRIPPATFQFQYLQGALKARDKRGLLAFQAFPDFDEIYESNRLFPFFTNRLLQRIRPEYQDHLRYMGLTDSEADPLTVLSRTRGLRHGDQFEVFAAPQSVPEGFDLYFFAAEIRTLSEESIARSGELVGTESLRFDRATHFGQDPFAWGIRDRGCLVGYAPPYIARELLAPEKNGAIAAGEYDLRVARMNPLPAFYQMRLLCRLVLRISEGTQFYTSPEFQPVAQPLFVNETS